MFMGLIQMQSITLIILILFIWQKKGQLNRDEGRSLVTWVVYLMIGNLFLTCLYQTNMSAFNVLMIASVNGLVTIAYLFIQKITIKKSCYK